jgi:hypothetical protein
LKSPSTGLRLAVLLFTTLSSLGAKSSTRTVEGVVMDQHSHPLDRAVAQIHNDWTLAVRSYITRADGKYHFAELSLDTDYKLSADHDGIRSKARTLSKFDSHEKREMDLTLHLPK